MRKFRLIIGIWVMLSIMTVMGCVEEFEANVSDIPTEGLVIEGNIISDSTVVFQLSRTLPLNVDSDKDLFDTYLDVNAELSVKGSDGTSWTGDSQGRGQYRVDIGTLQPDVEYHLEIQYKGDMYQSEPQKPLATVGIERITFSQPDLNGPVSIRLDTGESDGTQYYLWYFEEDWEVRAHFVTTDLYDPWLDRIVHYDYAPVAQGWCYSGTDRIILGTTESYIVNKVVGKTIQTIQNTDNRLSVLYSIRVQQRNLTCQEYEYYQVRAKLNSEMGGLFTPQPSELPTNITCSNPDRKVVGYVGCNMGISRYQLYVPENEVFYMDNNMCGVEQAPEGPNQEKYAAGFQVCLKELNTVEWARIKCVDVRTLQADPKGRPSWWPNPYLYYKESEVNH